MFIHAKTIRNELIFILFLIRRIKFCERGKKKVLENLEKMVMTTRLTSTCQVISSKIYIAIFLRAHNFRRIVEFTRIINVSKMYFIRISVEIKLSQSTSL